MPTRADFPQPCNQEAKFDWLNMLEADRRDPRTLGEGPCGRRHLAEQKFRTNRWCAWLTCSRCALRLTYAPAKDAPTNSIAMGPTPETVRKALAELGDSPTANTMRGLIRKHQGKKQASTSSTATPSSACQAEPNEYKEPTAKSKSKPSVQRSRKTPAARPSTAPNTSAPSSRAAPQDAAQEPEEDDEEKGWDKNVDRWGIFVRKALRLQATLESMMMVDPDLEDDL